MPDKRTHRGPHPEDAALFAADAVPRLRSAVDDFSLLLTRGYAEPSALKVVGNRYGLTARQRTAVMRCSCSDDALQRRRAHEIPIADLRGQPLLIDGYNLLTTIEAALGGGVILAARDGTYRDMASMHGTYHGVEETGPALALIGETLDSFGVAGCHWYLDSPVSNSGRLKRVIADVARGHSWDWRVELVPNPDTILSAAEQIVVTADSVILDRCARWANLARAIVSARVPEAWIVDVGDGAVMRR